MFVRWFGLVVWLLLVVSIVLCLLCSIALMMWFLVNSVGLRVIDVVY